MTDVPEILRAVEKIITEKLSPNTDDPAENWPRYLALLRISHVAEDTASKYEHAADEMGD